MTERNKTIILGREIGTDTGWDSIDDFAICLYDFSGTIAGEQISGALLVDFSNGTLAINDEDNPRTWDMSVITNLPRSE